MSDFQFSNPKIKKTLERRRQEAAVSESDRTMWVVLPILAVLVFAIVGYFAFFAFPQAGKEALDKELRSRHGGAVSYTIDSAKKGTNNFNMRVEDVWCVSVTYDKSRNKDNFLLFRTGLRWSVYRGYESEFLRANCRNWQETGRTGS
jgi:hypothetical protein